MGGVLPNSSVPSIRGVNVIASAVARIYTEGGLLAFWTGNGLSVAKIFPESAIKFFSYESSVSWIPATGVLILMPPAETRLCEIL
jgi:solute carrier family 25 phosphate transporter 23/24/25/41